ncbi:response regulator [Jiulongibacter sp. NS-SX5]|uniref:response regulator n=1 Tax=Jiulongibacter sp. NS-SX5 TaxID=3463854 RepID=UPI004059A6BF
MFNPKIFIVDDDPFWVAILEELLTDQGFDNITTYDNGSDCLDNLHKEPEIIFLDKEMDGIDGLEVLESLKKQNENVEVIFCTAHEDLSVAVQALRNGSNDFLLKSNANKKSISELMENLQRMLAR